MIGEMTDVVDLVIIEKVIHMVATGMEIEDHRVVIKIVIIERKVIEMMKEEMFDEVVIDKMIKVEQTLIDG